MSEQVNTEKAVSVLGILGGVFAGLIAGILISMGVFVAIMSAFGGGRFGVALAEILNLSILVLGFKAALSKPHSSLAKGALIGISVAFLLNALCGFMMLSWR